MYLMKKLCMKKWMLFNLRSNSLHCGIPHELEKNDDIVRKKSFIDQVHKVERWTFVNTTFWVNDIAWRSMLLYILLKTYLITFIRRYENHQFFPCYTWINVFALLMIFQFYSRIDIVGLFHAKEYEVFDIFKKWKIQVETDRK